MKFHLNWHICLSAIAECCSRLNSGLLNGTTYGEVFLGGIVRHRVTCSMCNGSPATCGQPMTQLAVSLGSWQRVKSAPADRPWLPRPCAGLPPMLRTCAGLLPMLRPCAGLLPKLSLMSKPVHLPLHLLRQTQTWQVFCRGLVIPCRTRCTGTFRRLGCGHVRLD